MVPGEGKRDRAICWPGRPGEGAGRPGDGAGRPGEGALSTSWYQERAREIEQYAGQVGLRRGH